MTNQEMYEAIIALRDKAQTPELRRALHTAVTFVSDDEPPKPIAIGDHVCLMWMYQGVGVSSYRGAALLREADSTSITIGLPDGTKARYSTDTGRCVEDVLGPPTCIHSDDLMRIRRDILGMR